MALQLLSHGEPQWETKVNEIINYLNSDGAIGKLNTSPEGIVFTNFKPWNDSDGKGTTTLKVMRLGAETLVHLHIQGEIANDPGSTHAVKIMNIPASLAPGEIKHEAYPLGENPSNGIGIVEIISDGEVNVAFPSNFAPGVGVGVWADAYYLAQE